MKVLPKSNSSKLVLVFLLLMGNIVLMFHTANSINFSSPPRSGGEKRRETRSEDTSGGRFKELYDRLRFQPLASGKTLRDARSTPEDKGPQRYHERGLGPEQSDTHESGLWETNSTQKSQSALSLNSTAQGYKGQQPLERDSVVLAIRKKSWSKVNIGSSAQQANYSNSTYSDLKTSGVKIFGGDYQVCMYTLIYIRTFMIADATYECFLKN